MPLQWDEVLIHVLIVTAVIGNGLVIYLITTRRKLRTTTNWFVLSLALADFGLSATFPARQHRRGYTTRTPNSRLLWYFFAHGSSVSLGILTLDRYIAITKPFRYIPFMKMKRVALLISLAWMIVLLLIIVDIVAADSGNFVFHFVVQPLIAVSMLVATIKIFFIARKHSRRNAAVVKQLNFNYANHIQVPKPPEIVSAKIVLIMVSVFLIYSFINTWFMCCNTLRLCTGLSDALFVCNKWLALLNALANPIAYALYKREMRREIGRTMAAFKRFCPRVF